MHQKILSRSRSSRLSSGLALLACFALNASLHAQQSMTTQGIEVTGAPVSTPHPTDDTRPKLEHIMREVDGTQITVTKKATVIPLDKQPPIQNNNLQEQFTKEIGRAHV